MVGFLGTLTYPCLKLFLLEVSLRLVGFASSGVFQCLGRFLRLNGSLVFDGG